LAMDAALAMRVYPHPNPLPRGEGTRETTVRFDVVTLFPELFSGYLGQSLLAKAIERGLVDVALHDLRQWAQGKHHKVDDRPFGGGPGMVLMVEPVVQCIEAVREIDPRPGRLVMLTPRGRTLNQRVVEELAASERLVLLCGRYEGFDERVTEILQPEELSIGDFVLNGGEVAAMVVIETVVRLIPGFLGDEESSIQDSFSSGNRWLECPQYTRPREFRGHAVPDVLLSGDHEAIARWRKEQSYLRTKRQREDLLD
jgi:tRNA (guanine37-N1)-methyltransferase